MVRPAARTSAKSSAKKEVGMADEKVTRRSILNSSAPSTIVKSRPSAGAVTADGPKMSVVVINDLNALEKYVPAWEDLAATAIEPNVFYEPWMVIPAIR